MRAHFKISNRHIFRSKYLVPCNLLASIIIPSPVLEIVSPKLVEFAGDIGVAGWKGESSHAEPLEMGWENVGQGGDVLVRSDEESCGNVESSGCRRKMSA